MLAQSSAIIDAVVRAVGLEPTRAYALQILSLICLPFHHARILREGRIDLSVWPRPELRLLSWIGRNWAGHKGRIVAGAVFPRHISSNEGCAP